MVLVSLILTRGNKVVRHKVTALALLRVIRALLIEIMEFDLMVIIIMVEVAILSIIMAIMVILIMRTGWMSIHKLVRHVPHVFRKSNKYAIYEL